MTMTVLAALVLTMQAATPAPAPAPALSPQSQAALRCSAAFALVSYGQEAGDPEAGKWPQIDPRGREYFVRAMAQIMDETGIDRDTAAALAQHEAKKLLDDGQLDAVMPACLILLDASGV